MYLIPSFTAETWTLLALFFALLLTYGIWPLRLFSKRGIPGPRPLPFFGNMLSFRRGIQNFDVECRRKYGRVWGILEGRKPIIMVTDPAVIKTVMVKEFYTLFTNRRVIGLMGPMSDAVSLVEDEKWKRIRSVLSPSFTSGRLKEVFPIVQHYADALMNNLKKKDLEQPVQIKEMIGPYSMDVITSSSFSVDIDSINNANDPFVTQMKKLLNFNFLNPVFWIAFLFPFLTPVVEKLGFSFFPRGPVNYFYDIIRKVKDERRKDDSDRVDFLKLMIQSEISVEQANAHTVNQVVKGLTDHEILSQSFIYVLAGYETTSVTLSFLLFNLATNPDSFKKLQDEIDEVFPNKTPVTYEALLQMEYLEMVINESMRLWPTAPHIERVCKATAEVNGYTIPKGAIVKVSVFALHRDPTIWESPDAFKPERFSKENKDNIDPYTFMPFGFGPRNCIGMRFALLVMKVVVVMLLQNFDMETCKETQLPLELTAMYRPKKPITLKLVPRDAKQ
ncbi:cytochrome P450 3A40-like isoform X1 [Conger conger]|uniref:cytochrome P450 3A40-like isoform X1 n=2 Tax=Conger conger TaxID=82655 RepID=UPI002A5A1997|nr:cytochrome P450 3A40-like isoform X1 [Conger conger]